MKHVKLFEEFDGNNIEQTKFNGKSFKTFDELQSYLETNGVLGDAFKLEDKLYKIVEYGSTKGGFGGKGIPDYTVYRNTEEPYDEIYKEHLSRITNRGDVTQEYSFLKVERGEQYDYSLREQDE